MAVAELIKGNESQFVSFKLGTEEYGLDINNVQEIIKVPSITRVPRAPFAVEGVVNLRGSILPILDARKRFDMESIELMNSTRIIVTNKNDMNVGLIVDSVSEVIRINSSKIEQPPPLIKNSSANYIKGIGKLNNGKRLISLLDLDKMLEMDSFMDDLEAMGEKYAAQAEEIKEKVLEESQMVSFQLGSEEYAVDINLVDEIIRIPEITLIPDAPSHVKGVICLRGNVLPVINLRYLFNMMDMETNKRSRILVIKLTNGEKNLLFGLIVDYVNEVISIPLNHIENPPDVVSSMGRNIEGIGKLDNGKRLILILNPQELIDGSCGGDIVLGAGRGARIKDIEQEERTSLDEQQLVSLKIGSEEYGINIMNVQEIIRLNKITTVPGAPDYVKGVVNLRGNVLPVIDMRARFGMEEGDLTDSDRIIVVMYKGKATGLIVDSVSEVIQISAKDIEKALDVVSDDRSKFIDGIGKLDKGERFIIILNIAEILGYSSQKESETLEDDFSFTGEEEAAPSLSQTDNRSSNGEDLSLEAVLEEDFDEMNQEDEDNREDSDEIEEIGEYETESDPMRSMNDQVPEEDENMAASSQEKSAESSNKESGTTKKTKRKTKSAKKTGSKK